MMLTHELVLAILACAPQQDHKKTRVFKQAAEMDYGPWIAATVGVTKDNVTPKGIVISLTRDRSANILFDTELLRVSAAWTEGWLHLASRAYADDSNDFSWINGTTAYTTPCAPGWAKGGSLVDPRAMVVDGNGRLFVADTGQHRVVRVAVAGGDVRNVAGDGSAGDEGDDWAAIWARLRLPGGVALDAQGNLFVADTANQRVRRIGAMPVLSAEVVIRDLDQPVGPDWQASPDAFWLSLSPSAGRGPSTATVLIDTAGLWETEYGSITVYSVTGVTPVFVEVQVHVGFGGGEGGV